MDRNIFELTIPPNKDDFTPCKCRFIRTFPRVQAITKEIPRYLAMDMAVQFIAEGFSIESDKWNEGTHHLKLLQHVTFEGISFNELNELLDQLPRIGSYERRLNKHLDTLDEKRWLQSRYLQAA